MSHRKRIVIAGGTGFVGGHLVAHLSALNYDVVVLSRSGKAPVGARGMTWSFEPGPWESELDGAFAVINLVGEPIAQRWTEQVKKEIVDSRVNSATAFARAIGKAEQPPEVWLNASAVGYYGDTGDRPATEATAAGEGFLAEVAVAWEAAVLEPKLPKTRRIVVRFGTILGRDGGALPPLAKLARLGGGSAIGDGRQYIAWIHIYDLVRMIAWAIETPGVHGALNGTSPNPVTNDSLMTELRAVYGRPPVPKIPAGIFKIVSGFVGVPPELILMGSRVLPEIPQGRGFTFKYPTLKPALTELLVEAPAGWQTMQQTRGDVVK